MYVIINKINNTCYIVSDVPQISEIINISRSTVSKWFLNGNTHKKKNNYLVYKVDRRNILKSNRGGLRNNSIISNNSTSIDW